MSNEKKYSPREAALAVLGKTQEILKKAELEKAEKTKHDRCVEHVMENSPEVKNPHAVCVAQGVKPASWGKSEDITPPDEIQNQVAPENNPKEQKEGNNPPWGAFPEVKGHIKLAKFCGHIEAKRKSKKPGAV